MKPTLVFWFTGLSGAGKTTIATRVEGLLKSNGFSVLILDGDDVRQRLHKHLGFSQQDIKENNALIVKLCQQYIGEYDVILVPIISPFRESRARARALLKNSFYEVYFSADLPTVIKRDVKGLYAKAKNKEITDLIGYSSTIAYEPPAKPDFVVNSQHEKVEESVGRFYLFVVNAMKKEANAGL